MARRYHTYSLLSLCQLIKGDSSGCIASPGRGAKAYHGCVMIWFVLRTSTRQQGSLSLIKPTHPSKMAYRRSAFLHDVFCQSDQRCAITPAQPESLTNVQNAQRVIEVVAYLLPHELHPLSDTIFPDFFHPTLAKFCKSQSL